MALNSSLAEMKVGEMTLTFAKSSQEDTTLYIYSVPVQSDFSVHAGAESLSWCFLLGIGIVTV